MSQFTSQTGRAAGRIGGVARTSKLDPSELARSGQRGLLARFEREVDPEGLLDPEERTKRAIRLRKAHMRRMALIRTRNRAKRAATAQTATS